MRRPPLSRSSEVHESYFYNLSFDPQACMLPTYAWGFARQMLHKVVIKGERPAQAFCEQGWGGDADEAARYNSKTICIKSIARCVRVY